MKRLIVTHENKTTNGEVISSAEFREFLAAQLQIKDAKAQRAVNEDALYLTLQKLELKMEEGKDLTLKLFEDDDCQKELAFLTAKYQYVLIDSALL